MNIANCILLAVLTGSAYWDRKTCRVSPLAYGLLFSVGLMRVWAEPAFLGSAFVGMLTAAAIPGLLRRTVGGLGGGDARLAAAAGLILGPLGILWALLIGGIAFLLGAALRRKTALPFVPFLAFGVWVVCLVSLLI